MGKLPILRAAEVLVDLERAGFEEIRMKGCHKVLVNRKTGARTVVAIHTGDMDRGHLRTIIRQAGLTPEDFLKLIE